ncbi:hypothetical protein TrCOL_g6759 [Triparma columacea]|uniref:Uncharacterized protein n=1 Tax=Triparma columacea TaxID=722753 RepID=A0A9W7G437_9STRA|nr:hypothetical protein TrCOL_g6759 [Triparma columacea]
MYTTITPQYSETVSINAPLSAVVRYLNDTARLASLVTSTGEPFISLNLDHTLQKTDGKTPSVGLTFAAVVFGAPAPFIGTFSKVTSTPDGYELQWVGSIKKGCVTIAAFEHGFALARDNGKTVLTHYEAFPGGIVGCLPKKIAGNIVKKNYVGLSVVHECSAIGTRH